MRTLGSIRMGLSVLAVAGLLVASNSFAGGFGAPTPPDVFSGDFGIALAQDAADGASSALDDIENITPSSFPWSGGFEFPATLPPVPAGGVPLDLSTGNPGGTAGRPNDPAPVPEPEPAILTALGIIAFGLSRRRCGTR